MLYKFALSLRFTLLDYYLKTEESMQDLCVVLGCKSGQELSTGHFGDSKEFLTYKIFKNGKTEKVSVLENTQKEVDESQKHGAEKKRGGILKLLGDIDIIVAAKMSPNFKQINESKPVLPVVCNFSRVDEIVKYFENNAGYFMELIERKKSGGIVEIPVIPKE